LGNDRSSKVAKWSEKYGTILIAFSCLLSAMNTWGNNWILTGVLVGGVLICGTIGIFDVKRAITKEKVKK